MATNELSNYVLTEFPVLLKSTLKYLPAKDLNSCARVCKLWNKIVYELKPDRKYVSCFFGQTLPHKRTVKGQTVSRVNDLYIRFTHRLKTLWCEPQQVLVFLTEDLYRREEEIEFPVSKRQDGGNSEFQMAVSDILPKSCEPLLVAGSGIIGSSADTLHASEIESGKALAAIFFPKIDGLKIETFGIDNQQEDIVFAPETDCFSDAKNVKLLLYFYMERADEEITDLLRSTFPNAIIAGGHSEALLTSNEMQTHYYEDDVTQVGCVAFRGENIKVRSVILDPYIKTPEAAEAKLQQLKDCNLDEEKSFAFQIACCGRGAHHYKGAKNVETTIFRKMFPKTPLLGFFGSGEVGYDFLADVNDKEAESRSHKDENELHRGFTSVFAFVSITQ